jgi:hypothetical protein
LNNFHYVFLSYFPSFILFFLSACLSFCLLPYGLSCISFLNYLILTVFTKQPTSWHHHLQLPIKPIKGYIIFRTHDLCCYIAEVIILPVVVIVRGIFCSQPLEELYLEDGISQYQNGTDRFVRRLNRNKTPLHI